MNDATFAHYPLFADLRGERCLVVGGGTVAARKAEALLAAGAAVTVVAPALGPALAARATAREIVHRPTGFAPSQLEGVLLVVAATDDAATNHAVARSARARAKLVNVVDDPDVSTCINPALVRRGPLTIAIGTGGASPVLARLVRARLEALLPQALGRLATLAARFRARVKCRFEALDARRRFWEKQLDDQSPVLRALEAGDEAAAERLLEAALAARRDTAPRGFVSLVGAGPGDPELLTLRALRTLQRADVVLYDRLVPAAILALARRDADFEDVGKVQGLKGSEQTAINARLVELARRGRHVVRLKGGDPFVFGRGGEELLALRAAGIDYEVVPGITAAVACAAAAGIPLTHRGLAQQVTFVTAHGEDAHADLDWPALARGRHTLAFYMGVGRVAQIRDGLLAHGRDPGTPAAIVERGTTPQQRVWLTTLEALPATVAARAVQAPAMILVGEVAALAAEPGGSGAVQPEAATPALERVA
ncbi:MAG: uroporphyrinogen-III C-methyltransferase [Gammaproteobacteria bacterium]|nr:uroporphyrinogen-III C-methyltransferase [Gammaproteobacteria bacterium]